jgi:hypothetical protein
MDVHSIRLLDAIAEGQPKGGGGHDKEKNQEYIHVAFKGIKTRKKCVE